MKSPNKPLIQALTLAALLLMLATSRCESAQPYQPVQPDPVLEPWRWRSFPELKGLGLQCLAEDREGNMWFGVTDGVVRYDGINWTAYTEADGLYGAPVEVLCTARDGSVYAGTELGISRFQDGTWRRVFPPEGELTWHVKDLMEASDGSLWAGTVWGALRLGREGETLYTTQALAAALRVVAPWLRTVTVPNGAVPLRILAERPERRQLSRWYWRAISEPGVVYALAPGGPGEAAGLQVGDRIVDVEGLTEDRLLNASVKLKVEREGQTFETTVTRPLEEGTVRNFWISDVCEDREGAIWFGLSSGEILRWNRSTGSAPGDAASWRLYTEADYPGGAGWNTLGRRQRRPTPRLPARKVAYIPRPGSADSQLQNPYPGGVRPGALGGGSGPGSRPAGPGDLPVDDL